MTTLSDALHAAQVEYGRQEARVSELLDTIYGDVLDGKWSSFTSDYYDESIEVYGVTPTQDALDKLLAVGFRRVWQHNHDEDNPHRSACRCGPTGPR